MTNPRPTSWLRSATAAMGSLVPSAFWVALIVSSIVFYERLESARRWGPSDGERIAFAVAFSVSGSLAMVTTLAVFGTMKRAVTTTAAVAVLLVVPGYQLLQNIDPSYRTFRGVAINLGMCGQAVRPGTILGLISGSVASAAIVGLGLATRRRLPWPVMMACVGAVFLVLNRGLPAVLGSNSDSVARLADYVELGHAMIAGLTGAIVGPVWGASVAGAAVWWARPRMQSPSSTAQLLHEPA